MNATTPGAAPLRSGRAARLVVAALLVLGVLQLTTGRSEAIQFCNTSPILGRPGLGASAGPALTYPSEITVSGLTGTITDVNVILHDFTTRGDNNSPPEFWPEDTDILVSGPTGANVILMSDAGGNNDVTSGPVNDIDLTFDDQAANQLPADSLLTSGTWRPVNDSDPLGEPPQADIPDEWPSPAPTPSGSTMLSTFNGLDPNGVWRLFMVDDQGQSASDIEGGWCVDIITSGTGTTVTTTPTTTSTSTSTTIPPTTSTSTSTVPPPTTSTSSTVPQTTSTSTAPGTCGGLTPTIVGTSGYDSITGTPGPDVIVGLGGNDLIRGLGGDDVICGGAGNDQVFGGDGNDRIFGEADNDQLFGEAGNDTVSGGTGNDRASGGNDNDALSGDGGTDQCLGDAGTDSASTCESISGLP